MKVMHTKLLNVRQEEKYNKMFGMELSSTSYLIVAHKIRLFQYWNNQYMYR